MSHPKTRDSPDLSIINLADWSATNVLSTDALFQCLIDYMSKYSFMLVGANISIFKHPESGEICKLIYEYTDEFGRPHIDTPIV